MSKLEIMKTMRYFILSFLVLLCLACSNNDIDQSIENCNAFSISDILTEEERQSMCIYNKVYRYQSKLYTVCECCHCRKIPKVNDCNGNSLCDLNSNCRKEFYQDAEYLFSIRSK